MKNYFFKILFRDARTTQIKTDVLKVDTITTNNSGVVTFSVPALLADGSTAVTQTANDNSTKLSTTAYVDAGLATKTPLNIYKDGSGLGTPPGLNFTGAGVSVGSSGYGVDINIPAIVTTGAGQTSLFYSSTQLKELQAGTNVTFTDNGTYLTINSAGAQGPQGDPGPQGTAGAVNSVENYSNSYTSLVQNPGSNNPIYIYPLQAGSGISLTNNGDRITIDATGGGSSLEVDIDGSNQGNFSSINFKNDTGSSSSNQIFIGNNRPFYLNGSYQFQAQAIDFQGASLSQSSQTNPNTGQTVTTAVVSGLQGPAGNDGATGPAGPINTVYDDGSSYGSPSGLNFTTNIGVTSSGYGVDIFFQPAGGNQQLQFNSSGTLAATNFLTDATNIGMNGGSIGGQNPGSNSGWQINADGSGFLSSNNINFDTSGNLNSNGRVDTNTSFGFPTSNNGAKINNDSGTGIINFDNGSGQKLARVDTTTGFINTPQLAITNTGLSNGNTLLLPTGGGNATMGTATLIGGTVTVSTTQANSGYPIFISLSSDNGGTPGSLTYTVVNDSSFTVTSSTGALDNSTFNWVIFQPN